MKPPESHSLLRDLAAAADSGARARLLRAIHFAAHAVAAEACGADYTGLRLELKAQLGAASDGCGVVPAGVAGRGPARTPTEAAIIVALAGCEAESLAAAQPVAPCLDVTQLLTDGNPAEAAPYIEWLRLKALRTVEHPLRQRVIAVLAVALAAKGALSAGDVRATVDAEVSRYMRGQ